jgi:alpha-mannosidase
MVEVGGITATLIGSQQNPKAWRQHLAPSQLFYSWIMNNHWHTNYRADQEGPTVFRYVIWVHQGPINLSESARFGMAMSQPLIVAPALGKLVKPPLDTVTPYDVLVTAFKPSDDGKAWILRLFGASGKAEQAKLHWRDPQPKAMWLSDISEKPIRKVEGGVDVPAWGIVTLRVELP